MTFVVLFDIILKHHSRMERTLSKRTIVGLLTMLLGFIVIIVGLGMVALHKLPSTFDSLTCVLAGIGILITGVMIPATEKAPKVIGNIIE